MKAEPVSSAAAVHIPSKALLAVSATWSASFANQASFFDAMG